MASYHHRVNTHYRSQRARKIKKIATLSVFLLVVGSLVVGVDWLILKFNAGNTAISVESSATVQSSNINIFRTPFFQFQTNRTWREVDVENSQQTRYVYRSFNGMLVQHELIVEIDDNIDIVLDNEDTSRILPVTIENNKLTSESGISPHCRELTTIKDDKNQQYVKYKNTTFPCNPTSGQFVVLVGQIGGEHYLKKDTPKGVRTYKIIYRDSTFSPSGQPLDNIINTFLLL